MLVCNVAESLFLLLAHEKESPYSCVFKNDFLDLLDSLGEMTPYITMNKVREFG